MVSDTPSSREEKQNAAKPEGEATDKTQAGATGVAARNDAAVETAMADVAAAIKRHEEHQDDADGQMSENGSGEDADENTGAAKKETSNAGGSTPPSPPSPPASAKGHGFGALLAAGVAGAVIALAGAAALYSAGVFDNGASDRIDGEIASLRQDIETMKANDKTGDLRTEVDSLKKQVDATAKATDATAITNLQKQVASLQTALKSDDGAVQSLQNALADVKSSVSAGEQKLAALEKKVNTPGKDLAVARAIAAAALKSAIDRGENFTAELSTYLHVAPKGSDLTALSAHAESGIPTREELAGSFSQDADAIIAATEPPPPEGNIFNRLVDSAKGLVSVRPVGDAEGDSVPAIVARIEHDLTAGDLQQAEAEWETLPEAGKQASAKFADDLKARITADGLVTQTLSSALDSTAGAPATGSAAPSAN